MARRKRSRSRKGRMPAGLARYWAAQRRGGSNPKRRRRARKNQPFVMANPRRRRRNNPHVRAHHRRRGRRNPGLGTFLPSTGFLKEVTMVAGGFYATKISSGFVLPMIGISGNVPRIAIKGAVAFGVAYLGGMFLGSRAKESLLLGGGLEVLQDAIRTWVSPFVPALAAAEMESYYLPGAADVVGGEGGVGAYYQVGELPSDNYAG